MASYFPILSTSPQATTPDDATTASMSCPMSNEGSKRRRTVDAIVTAITGTNTAWTTLNEFYDQNSGIIDAVVSKMYSVDVDSQAAEEAMKVVSEGLVALGQVHPFIGVAVVTFNAMVALHLKRKDNDKKVQAVLECIQDTLAVLFDLRRLKEPDQSAKCAERMKELMTRIEATIKETGAVCDHYQKKRCFSKTMKAPVYEHRFAEKSIIFARYKTELMEALSLHIAAGVDAANKKLDDQKQQMDRIEGKMNDMTQLFRRLDTEQEQDARRVVDEAGGVQQCLESEEHLKKLMNAYGMGSPKALSDLKRTLQKEYEEDLDEALKMHMQQFERKLAAQQQELMNAIKTTEKTILTALQSGAHERIKDSDLSTIWKEMNWKGSVKARHFVLALHDHFNDRRSGAMASHRSSPGPNFLNDNEWPLSYININHVQPILEAFDDDGTGFVTIKEVNTFAQSRPDGWTLPHWIAYWAAGWHASVEKYRNYIYRLIQDMIKVSRAALPENRPALDQYLSDQSFGRIELLLRSTRSLSHSISADRCLSQATEAYTRLEEERLEEALSRMAYDIDTPEVVSLITGPGRIERFIFPLLYLLMKRHIAIVTMTKEHVLHSNEFGAMATTLASIFEVLDDRIDGLASLFRQAHTDIRGRFRNFAFGMMELSYDLPSVRDPKRNTLCTWQPPRKFMLPSVDLGKPELKYEIKSKRRNHANVWHLGIACDGCNQEIWGERNMCLDCMSENFADNINLCSECCPRVVSKGAFVHSANHLMLKTKRFILDAELAWMVPKAHSTDERLQDKRTALLPPHSSYSLPNSWICFDCSRDSHCNDLEHCAGSSEDHLMLKTRDLREAKSNSAEARLEELETRLASIQKLLEQLLATK